MNYIMNYDEFVINEGILGNIFNFLKKLWGGLINELNKLENPDPKNLKEFVANKVLSTKSNSCIFKGVADEFNKKSDPNDQDCLDMVKNMIDPVDGVLSDNAIKDLTENLKKSNKDKIEIPFMLGYILNIVRNKIIVETKYAGSSDGKVDPQKITVDLNDTNHLPDYKSQLKNANDGKAKKKVAETYYVKLIEEMIKINNNITDDEINKYLEDNNVEKSTPSVSDIEKTWNENKEANFIYVRDGHTVEEWNKLDDNKKKDELEKGEMVSSNVITKIDNNKVTFKGKDGKEFEKDIQMVIGIDNISQQQEENKEQSLDDSTKDLSDEKKATLNNFVTKLKEDKLDKNIIDAINGTTEESNEQ